MGSEPSPDAGVRLHRRGALTLLVLAGALLAVLAGWLVPWEWVPGGHVVPVPTAEFFTAAQLARAERYSHAVRWLSQAGYAVSLLVAVGLGATTAGARLMSRIGPLRSRRWLAIPGGVLIVLLLQRLVALPFGLRVRSWNLREGLTHQGLAGWFGDRLLSLLVSWVVLSGALVILLGCARRWPRWWFAVAGSALVVLTFAVSMLYPLVVEPLFNRFTPMADGPLKQSILRLADDAGVKVDDVLVADASRRTTTVNAYVSGLGGTRRIVVYDNLVTDLSPREARAVIAHELGHARHNDVLLGTTLAAVGSLAAVSALALLLDAPVVRRRAGVSGPVDTAGVPLVLAIVAVGGFLVSPAQNTVSRAIEARADRFSLEITSDRPAFDEMQVQLARRSLNDPTPPPLSQLWFGTHPTVLQRLGIAAALLPDEPTGAGAGSRR